MRVRVRSLIVVLGIAAAMTAAGAILLTPSTPSVKNESSRPAAVTSRSDRLTASITRAQDRLKNVPGDYGTWAALGTAYIEKARITADPSFYAKAEGALRKSLEVRPTDNDGALTGLGALANARHDFATAKDFATKALVINAYSADAYAVLTDAETQLGNSTAATDAVQHLLDLKPGLSALTRGSYDLELRGRVDESRALMTDALETAYDPADVAFCRYQLGELAFNSGDLAGAAEHFTNGLEADPTYLPLVQGRAKVAAARGDLDAAIADYAKLSARMPTPSIFLEYAELLRAAGRTADADAQLTLAVAAQSVFAANGGIDDLVGATLALAQNKPADAVRLARQEWQRRQFTDVADALAWALHAAGNDAEALDFAKKAGAVGARNAKYSYHLGMIELALGDRTAARADLKRAIDINPHFSPLDAPIAARTLAGLGS